MDRWRAYEIWNQAIADVFFNEDAAGQPVYLDLDDDAVSLLGQATDTPHEDVRHALATTVRGILSLDDSRRSIFSEPLLHLKYWLSKWRNTSRHERPKLDPPPVLGLLAAFSMAAERMGRDVDMAPHNYFGRLEQLLDITDARQRRRLKQHYRNHVEFFWHVLATWLTGLDGMRGLPSAFALTHRYIGLSLSQALVREHDRTKLPRFFATYGLSPGQEVAPGEMQVLLDDWLRKEPPPLSRPLAELWKRQQAARERVASVAVVELQAWDGVIPSDVVSPTSASVRQGEVRLVAISGLFGSSIEFSVVTRIRGSDGPTRVTVASAAGDEKPVLDLVLGAGGWLRLQRPAGLESASLLNGILSLATERGDVVQRRPRRVVPMRKDELLGLFLEVERLQLAEDALVLATSEVADTVERALKHVARPGFRRIDDSLSGLPKGWVLFRDVQVLAVLPTQEFPSNLRDDLNVLLPSVPSQLTFAGGLKLPGQMRKYSSLAAPELRAVATGAEHIRVQVAHKHTDELALPDNLARASVEQIVCERETSSSALVFPLNGEDLSDGDYEALLFLNRSEKAAQRLSFSLRSGDSVDVAMWNRRHRLVYNVAKRGGWAVVSADPWDGQSAPAVVGVLASGDGPALLSVDAPRLAWWTQDRPSGYTGKPSIILTRPDPTSCLVTGAHYWELPYTTSRTVEGVCKKCGLVKRFANNLWAARASWKWREHAAAYHVDLQDFEPVQPGFVTWDTALDALMHAGGGPFSALERIALQVEGSSLFVDKFVRALEALGHVQVRRDERTLHPVEWEITPSTLAGLPDGSFLLIGYWPTAKIVQLSELARARGGLLVAEKTPNGPSRRVVLNLADPDLGEVAESLEVTVVEDAARSILRLAPSLSAVEKALPQRPIPGARRVQQFHLASASWVSVPDAHRTGAYRLESFNTVDVIRRNDDVAQGTARIGTVQLVKHLEALAAGLPLVAYDPETRCLQVPLGADLPGLYGRAAVLCSGRPPEEAEAKRLLLYRDVPADVAHLLATLLSS